MKYIILLLPLLTGCIKKGRTDLLRCTDIDKCTFAKSYENMSACSSDAWTFQDIAKANHEVYKCERWSGQ